MAGGSATHCPPIARPSVAVATDQLERRGKALPEAGLAVPGSLLAWNWARLRLSGRSRVSASSLRSLGSESALVCSCMRSRTGGVPNVARAAAEAPADLRRKRQGFVACVVGSNPGRPAEGRRKSTGNPPSGLECPEHFSTFRETAASPAAQRSRRVLPTGSATTSRLVQNHPTKPASSALHTYPWRWDCGMFPRI